MKKADFGLKPWFQEQGNMADKALGPQTLAWVGKGVGGTVICICCIQYLTRLHYVRQCFFPYVTSAILVDAASQDCAIGVWRQCNLMIVMTSLGFCWAFLVCAASRRSACSVLKFNGQDTLSVHFACFDLAGSLDASTQRNNLNWTLWTPQKTDLHDLGELSFKVEQTLRGRLKSSVHWHGDVFLVRLALQLGVVLFGCMFNMN